ncbi:hypothetical protein EV138_4590 [Kribbella voronezhensis]|uniref:DUF7674 domain-containing protein n=1 Tax=Kribbella voronezhensis TaxID=2512212 RepID=A0A4R7TGM0_9ACTN|nr:hypothetical protein [Kribbella voronezhensis]TDU90989.1 hypothetical protein EV138_4590 [Kribbella voronezhensis]
MVNERGFLRRLLKAVPALRGEWDRARAVYEQNRGVGLRAPTPGSFLIGLAFSTVHRWVEGDAEAGDRLRALLAFLENEAADPETAEFAARFVSCLPDPGERDSAVLDLLGPRLRELKNEQVRRDDESVSPAVVAFLHRLADEIPFLRQQVLEHFEEYRNPLGHVVVGGLVPEVCARYAGGEVELIRPLLAFLEREFEQNPDVDNVIAVSFVEMLPSPDQPGAGIEHALGPKLRAELDRQRTWHP